MVTSSPLFVFVTGCLMMSSTTSSLPQATRPWTGAMNDFGVKMYLGLTHDHGHAEKSLVFSPLSVYTAMSLTMLGAGGSTLHQMERALHVNFDGEAHFGIKGYLSALDSGSENTTLSIANAIFVQPPFTVTKFFSSKSSYYYGSEVHSPITARAVNDWMAEETKGEIEKLVEDQDINGVSMILLNAVYFKGQWMSDFKKEDTYSGNFKGLQKDVQVEFMTRRGNYTIIYSEELNADILELPYQGDRYAMFIILPSWHSSLYELQANMLNQSVDLNAVLNADGYIMGMDVHIPKFSLETNENLNEILKNMGMEEAFAPGANFSRLTPHATHIDTVQHVAKIKVDEEGTVAAAVTEVIMGRSAGPSFFADRPFMFVVRDKTKMINLFIGHYTGPQHA